MTGSPVDGHDCYGCDGQKHSGEHDNDKPRGTICRLWRGLGDPHGVDENVRDEENELHVSWMMDPGDSGRIYATTVLSLLLNRTRWGVHLVVKPLPERWQAHTLRSV